MKRLIALLVFLISNIPLVGISFIDGKIWDVIFLVVGLVAYAIVGVLFSIGLLFTKKDGREAYAFVFLLLLLGGYGLYKLLKTIRNWILSWPLFVKILVPSLIIIGICVGVFFVARKMVLLKNVSNCKKESKF